MTSLRRFSFLICILALFVLAACSSNEKGVSNTSTTSAATTQPKPAKTPQAITAAQALSKMQGFAQKQWAADALPVHIESDPNSEANGQDGKSTVWMAVFGSQQKREIRTFHWSGSLDPSAPVAGVSSAPGSSPLTPQLASEMFQGFLLKADTDKAATVAVEHGGQNILKQYPNQQVRYIVVFDTKTNSPLCYVVYGEGLAKNRGFGIINAITGNFVKGGKAG